jgi:hypothetical protein
LGWDDTRIDAVRRAVDALNYGNPKYLLLLTAWYEAFHNRPSGGADLSPEDAAPIPRGLPEGVAPLRLVDPDTAPPEVQSLLKRATDVHFHHGAASDFRVLANWPDLLRLALDQVLEPVVRTEEYDAVARALLVQAREQIRGFPTLAGVSQYELADLCSPSELAGLSGLLFMYQRFISDVTIDMIRLKQAFDGPQAATTSPFPDPLKKGDAVAEPEALAFDLYGTLVDPIRIWKRLEDYMPNKDALRVAEVWRQKQLEFTFRLTVMERYEDFEQVTRKALDYALEAAGRELEADQKDALMAQYNDLERFADVERA